MNIGWIGLGKLGLPCALVMAQAGHKVVGTDLNGDVATYIDQRQVPYKEEGVSEAFAAGYSVGWRESVSDVVEESEIVFVAVQTPHSPAYEGCNPTPTEKHDFDYSFLVSAVREVVAACKSRLTLVIVSTVNPGTCTRELEPLVRQNQHIRFVYSPAFIAMGTTMSDFSNPEMVIVGTASDEAFEQVAHLHASIHNAPVARLSLIGCELVKMTYNTFIGLKIVFGNTIGEICEKVGGDSDEVIEALSLANYRLLSPRYLKSGMGDGGGCHPRDQLALSWLAERLDLSTDLFDYLMRARDLQTEWQASICREASAVSGLPIRICGREYKAETNLTTGSPSRLLHALLEGTATWQDEEPVGDPAVFFIGVNHDRYRYWSWPKGSIVIDPWGFIPDCQGVTVRRLGRRRLLPPQDQVQGASELQIDEYS